MMNKVSKLFLGSVFVVMSLLSIGFATSNSFASSDAGKEACAGLESLGVDCNSGGQTAEQVASQPIKSLINTLSMVIGAAAVIMIIYGGFKFVSSGGDADKTKSARQTIIYAVIGLVVVLLAQTIVYFVFAKANELQAPDTSSTKVTRLALPVDKGPKVAIS